MKLRHCEIVVPTTMTNLEDLFEKAKSKQSIKRFMIIAHDKEAYVNPHYHVYLNFSTASIDVATIAKWFNVDVNFVNKLPARFKIKDVANYFIHKCSPDRYQYNLSDIIANFPLEELFPDVKIEYKRKITDTMQKVASDILIRLIFGCPDFSEELSKVYDEVYKYYKLCDDPYTHLPCSCKEYSENSLKLDKELMMEKYGHCDGLE